MKITRIILKDFHQFKDVEIDFTYPKGHKKEGEPLDKVCIIGQSGTGKTTLLKIIGGHTYTINSIFSEYKIGDFKGVSVYVKYNNGIETEVSVGFDLDDKKTLSYGWKSISDNQREISFEDALAKRNRFLEITKTHFVFFPADLHYEYETSDVSLATKKVIDFREDKIGGIWNLVFEEIQKFQEEEIKLKQDIARAAVEKSTDLAAIQKAVNKLEVWKKKSENPIIKLADDCLDPILKHINLKVKRDFKFETKGDIGLIKLEDLKGNEVPYHLLSTGTKQILLTALPLYLLKPKEALILCDEPERSLYPNFQKFITDFYISQTENSQFFFATHSPIIASNFEPWEIIELKFNDKGEVYQDQYYPKGAERHVDNYTIIPSYLTYDLMLNKVFDLTETHSNERSEKITETLMLRNQLLALKEKNKLDSVQGKKIYERYKDLASKLFWDFDLS